MCGCCLPARSPGPPAGSWPVKPVALNTSTAHWAFEHSESGSAVRGPAPLVGAVNRTRNVHYGSDVVHMDVVRIKVGVDVVGDLLRPPTPTKIVTDEVGVPMRASSWPSGHERPAPRS